MDPATIGMLAQKFLPMIQSLFSNMNGDQAFDLGSLFGSKITETKPVVPTVNEVSAKFADAMKALVEGHRIEMDLHLKITPKV
jgi:hypothetical protein